MAFGKQYNNKANEIARIQSQIIEEDDDDVSNSINNEESVIESNNISEVDVIPSVMKTTSTSSSRRPVFKTDTIEKAVRTSENVADEDDEDDDNYLVTKKTSFKQDDSINENASTGSLRNRRPNLNKENVIALSQSVETYFQDDSGKQDEVKNEDVVIALHVNEGNNTRAEAFKLKKNNRPNFNNKFVSAQEISSENYYRDAREQSGMENGLDIRLNTLIDRVCEYLNKKDDEIAKIKKEALRNPEAIRGEYQKIYNEVVEPETNKRYETIQSAKKENPDKFIFILVKDDKQKLVGFNKADHPAYAIYDGVTIKTLNYDRTPFGPPSELFANDDEPQEEKIA